MTAPGETDLAAMLATLDVVRRPGTYTYVEVGPGGLADPLAEAAEAMVSEDESISLVVPVETARSASRTIPVELAWLTLTVHSSLEAVGLTAAFSAALGSEGIACNVLAGYHHDHLLVPVERVDDAVRTLVALRSRTS